MNNSSKDNTLNIVVVGKSGVGKSSFLNYLLGKELFQTGVGTPVTQSYFDKQEVLVKDQGVRYVLYDTKGIEPTTTNECRRFIFNEIEARDKDENFFNWIHSVFYCFDSTASRIEPFELNFIKELTNRVSVIVLLTKSDKTEKERLDALTDEIHKGISSTVLTIPVCSIESNGTRKNPMPIHRFGREEVLKASFYGLWNKIATIIPYKCIEILQEDIHKLTPLDKKEILQDIEKKKSRFNNPNLVWLKIIQRELKNMPCCLSRELYDEVMGFYKKVNRYTPQSFYSTESQSAYEGLKLYYYLIDIDVDYIYNALSYIEKAKEDYDACLIWEKAEEKVLDIEIRHYKETIEGIKNRLQNKVDNFVNVYKGELLQYGRLAISSEKVESSILHDLTDLSKDECLYSHMVKYAIDQESSGCLYPKNFLEKLQHELQISDIRAKSIEDYIRNQ